MELRNGVPMISAHSTMRSMLFVVLGITSILAGVPPRSNALPSAESKVDGPASRQDKNKKVLTVAERVSQVVKRTRANGYCTSPHESCSAILRAVERDGINMSTGKVSREMAIRLIDDTEKWVNALGADHPQYSTKLKPYIQRIEQSRVKLDQPLAASTPMPSNSCSTGQLRPAVYNATRGSATLKPANFQTCFFYYNCIVGCAAAAAALGTTCIGLPPPVDGVCLAAVYAAQTSCSIGCASGFPCTG